MINKITPEKLAAIRRKSPEKLPNNPSGMGYTPEQIKRAGYGFVTDESDSVLAEMGRVVHEVNVELSELRGMLSGWGGGSSGFVTEEQVRRIVAEMLSGYTPPVSPPSDGSGECTCPPIENVPDRFGGFYTDEPLSHNSGALNYLQYSQIIRASDGAHMDGADVYASVWSRGNNVLGVVVSAVDGDNNADGTAVVRSVAYASDVGDTLAQHELDARTHTNLEIRGIVSI